MDDELSPRARMLVEVALEEDMPPPSIADGSWEMVVSRLTIEAASAQPPAAASSPTRVRGGIVFVVLGLVVVVAGVLLWLVVQPRPKPMVPAAPPPAMGPHATTPSVAPATTPATAPATAPVDDVATAKLLDEAEAAEPARALELLARHAEIAPLDEEADRRMALRIVALCALHRDDDAKADARAFLSRPRDPAQTKRVRASCAGP